MTWTVSLPVPLSQTTALSKIAWISCKNTPWLTGFLLPANRDALLGRKILEPIEGKRGPSSWDRVSARMEGKFQHPAGRAGGPAANHVGPADIVAVRVVLRAEPRIVKLAQRIADIAVRVERPRESRVVAQRVATLEYGLFASQSYLERCGQPEDVSDLSGFDLVTFLHLRPLADELITTTLPKLIS